MSASLFLLGGNLTLIILFHLWIRFESWETSLAGNAVLALLLTALKCMYSVSIITSLGEQLRLTFSVVKLAQVEKRRQPYDQVILVIDLKFTLYLRISDLKFLPLPEHTFPLLKTELRTSDFQHFHWLAGHRLSAHIPAIPDMVNERISK